MEDEKHHFIEICVLDYSIRIVSLAFVYDMIIKMKIN